MKNKGKTPFSKDILIINDIDAECTRIANNLRENILNRLPRQGGVVGISGGIDSSVSLVLAVKALGKENILGVMMPEKDSSNDSARLAKKLADKFGVRTITEEITGALQGFGCYQRRDEAVKRIFPEYDPSVYKMKIGIMNSRTFFKFTPDILGYYS